MNCERETPVAAPRDALRPRLAALAGLAGLWLLAGCAGPELLEGSVRFRDQIGKEGKGGRTITVTTDDARKVRGVASQVPRESMGALVYDLEGLGLFSLRGRPESPADLPLGAIALDVTGRRFSVTVKDLTTPDESQIFSRASARIIQATQGGPHFKLGGAEK